MGKNRKYSAELKLQAVKTYLEGEKGSTTIAKELNLVSGRMLRRWVAIYQDHGENGFLDKRGLSKNNKGRPKKNFNSLEEENEYLRAKVDFLEALVNLDVKKK